jgi:hypothetical protein
LQQGATSVVPEKPHKSFVTGHDFSRAAEAA